MGGFVLGYCGSRLGARPPSTTSLRKPNLILLYVFLLFFASGSFAATSISDGDDFSNNLFSDLAPLLSLFGEQVAKQFMAGSLGWSDTILFAMAPLGIITAIIGAIRIGGPVWLKAIVGRARENRPAAEVELTTSTSEEVCELWNGTGIVRITGAPKILELIYFPDRREATTGGIYTVASAASKESGILKGHAKHSWGTSFLGPEGRDQSRPHKRVEKSPDEESLDQITVTANSAPNISLNLLPKRNTFELRAFAVFSILLQSGVVVFWSFSTYNSWLKRRMETEDTLPYGLPLAYIGTFFLTIGMLVCSFVVEASTRETIWTLSDPKDEKFRILWIQQGDNVSDQVFDSYAIFADGERSTVFRSRLSGGGDLFDSGPTLEQRMSTQTLVILGTFTSVLGFIVQFTGLRAMHWSASVAQLVATLIMVVVRAFVRRDLAKPPRVQKVPNGHELDWLATRMPSLSTKLWPDLDPSRKSKDIMQTSEEELWEEDCYDWGVVTGCDTNSYTFEPEVSIDAEKSHANRVVRVRERLGELSKWVSPVSDVAVSVAHAIDAVMNSVFHPDENFENPENINEWKWNIHGLHGQPIFLSIRRRKGLWEANAAEIEAVLSLWIYSVGQEDTEQKAGAKPAQPKDHKDDENSKKGTTPGSDWLRHGHEALWHRSLRLLGPLNPILVRDLWWYASSTLDKVVAGEELIAPDSKKGKSTSTIDHKVDDIMRQDTGVPTIGKTVASPVVTDTFQSKTVAVENRRIVGISDRKPAHAKLGTHTRHFVLYDQPVWDSKRPSDYVQKERGNLLLIRDSHTSILNLFAQDLFATFMWAVAAKMRRIEGYSEVISSDDVDWKYPQLRSDTLTRVVRDIEDMGGAYLGSAEDIYLLLIPPLSKHQRLPVPLSLCEYARNLSYDLERSQSWKAASEVNLWLYDTCKSYGSRHPLTVRCLSIMLVYLRSLQEQRKIAEDLDEKGTRNHLLRIEEKTLFHFQSADPEVIESLRALEFIQSRDSFAFDHLSPKFLEEYRISVLRNKLGYYEKWNQAFDYIQSRREILQLVDSHVHTMDWKSTFGRRGSEQNIEWGHQQDCMGWTPIHYLSATAFKPAFPMVASTLQLKDIIFSLAAADLSGKNPLHYVQNIESARILLRLGAPINARSRTGSTPLHCIAQIKNSPQLQFNDICGVHEGLAQFLIESGADVNALDNIGWSPLHWAIYRGNVTIAEILIKAGANTVMQDLNGRSPGHIAVLGGTLNDALFDSLGPEKFALADKEGRTPLHFASRARVTIMNGHDEYKNCGLLLVNRLDDQVRNIREKSGKTPLLWVIAHGTGELTRFFIENSIYRLDWKLADRRARLPLHYAAMHGFEWLIRTLLTGKLADANTPDARNFTPLHYAAFHGRISSAHILLRWGAHIETQAEIPTRPGYSLGPLFRGVTPLALAVSEGNYDFAQMLIVEYGAKVDGSGALECAIENDDTKMLQLLLTEGSGSISERFSIPNFVSYSPLHAAVLNGSLCVVRAFCMDFKQIVNETPQKLECFSSIASLAITEPVRPEFANPFGGSPLHTAVLQADFLMIKCLIEELGANINLQDDQGRTPLHYASTPEVASTLIDLGADVSIRSQLAETIIHTNLLARVLSQTKGGEYEFESTLRKLLSAGSIDVNSRDSSGRTILHRVVAECCQLNALRCLVNNLKMDVAAEDNTGRNALHYLAEVPSSNLLNEEDWYKCLELIATALEGNLEATDYNGNTALHLAIQNIAAPHGIGESMYRRPISQRVQYLVEKYNMDIHRSNNYGDTPTHLAAGRYASEMVRLFRRRSGPVRLLLNALGMTPLHSAVSKIRISVPIYSGERVSVVDALCEDDDGILNARDSAGDTALHYIVRNRDHSTLSHMLHTYVSRGLDAVVKNNNMETPLDIAISNSDMKALKLFFFVDDPLYGPDVGKILKGSGLGLVDISNTRLDTILASLADNRTVCYAISVRLQKCRAMSTMKSPATEVPYLVHIDASKDPYPFRLPHMDPVQLSLRKESDVSDILADASDPALIRELLEYSFGGPALLLKNQDDGFTPLHLAVKSNDSLLVRFILTDPSNCNVLWDARDKSGMTALHLAAKDGNVEVLRVLLRHESRDVGLLAMNRISASEDSIYGGTPLHWASLTGNLEVVFLFFDTGLRDEKSSKDGGTPYHWACRAGIYFTFDQHHELTTGLISFERDEKTGGTPLHWIARYSFHKEFPDYNHMPMADYSERIGPGMKDSVTGGTCYHWAAAFGNYKAMKKFICPLRINDLYSKDGAGLTPLHYAAMYGHSKIVRLLLRYAVLCINEVDNDGYTALHWAATYGHSDVVRLLCARKNLEFNETESASAYTALHLAAKMGHSQVIRILLQSDETGCEERTRDIGRTPLHEAVLNNQRNAVEALLTHGPARMDLRDSFDKTPMDIAEENGFLDIQELLHSTELQIAEASKHTPAYNHRKKETRPPDNANVLLNPLQENDDLYKETISVVDNTRRYTLEIPFHPDVDHEELSELNQLSADKWLKP